jgi:hypothetical protein
MRQPKETGVNQARGNRVDNRSEPGFRPGFLLWCIYSFCSVHPIPHREDPLALAMGRFSKKKPPLLMAVEIRVNLAERFFLA